MNKNGFTLIEIIVVISIMALITLSGMWVYNNVFERSRAAEIAADLQNIRAAWNLLLIDANEDSPHESLYSSSNPDAPCHDEPLFYDTDILTNATGLSNWNGPYLKTEPTDPWGRRYTYDNDGDTYIFNATSPSYDLGKGVNVVLPWCDTDDLSRYTRIAPLVDKMLDDGDGSESGSFRWIAAEQGAYFFLITAD